MVAFGYVRRKEEREREKKENRIAFDVFLCELVTCMKFTNNNNNKIHVHTTSFNALAPKMYMLDSD